MIGILSIILSIICFKGGIWGGGVVFLLVGIALIVSNGIGGAGGKKSADEPEGTSSLLLLPVFIPIKLLEIIMWVFVGTIDALLGTKSIAPKK